MKCCLTCTNISIDVGYDDYYGDVGGGMECAMSPKENCPWQYDVDDKLTSGVVNPLPFITVAEKCPYYREISSAAEGE